MRAITLIWIVFLTACTSRAVHDAETVVAQADSLRAEGRMYGIDEGDSATLAQAYETLSIFNSPLLSTLNPQLSTVFSHSCYHYGRLLREKDNPVEAMECFINATHSRTRDYHILGRVYSNMGDICHLASDFSLSYDMFERSGDVFLREKDSDTYFYCLYRMAYEKAEMGDSVSTFSLLKRVDTISGFSSYIALTQAELYLKNHQYRNAIHHAKIALSLNENQICTPMLILAQAYSYLREKDSAVYYANVVLSNSNEEFDINNALYILTNDDENKDIASVRETAANRADVQKIIEAKRSKTAQAVQLLGQDLNRKPDWWWLYAIIAFILFAVSLAILYYILRKRKQHRELIMDLREKEEEQSHLENTLNNLSQLQETKHLEIQKEAEEVCQLLGNSSDIRAELCWNNYEQMCTTVNLRLFGIIDRLQSFSLSEKEMRLCVLVLLQASTEQMVDMIPYARSGIGKLKYTTARKLGTTTSVMRSFILNLMG